MKMPTSVGIFFFIRRENFMVIWVWKKFYNLGVCICTKIWPKVIKLFFMLNSAEHEVFSANKYENANYCWHFHIY